MLPGLLVTKDTGYLSGEEIRRALFMRPDKRHNSCRAEGV